MFTVGLIFLVLFPICSGLICALFKRPRTILISSFISVLIVTIVAFYLSLSIFTDQTPAMAKNSWLFLDKLSAFHLPIMTLIFLMSSFFAVGFYEIEISHYKLGVKQIRQHAMLWGGALSAMILVLLSNNLGIMWVGIEATTLLTGFLISLRTTKQSLEAMWKYIIICSVGVGFAFIGTLFTAASIKHLNLAFHDSMMWCVLKDLSSTMNPTFMKAGFLFILVGYGTKVGLAPMHNWLPDAHSQAPSPVSAMFSGFMLNAAMYCIMRYIPLIEGATQGQGWGLELLRIFGLVSIVISAGFIVFQNNVKRLLAYHSVEHLGIIAVGLGLGGAGTFAALYHTFNHSISKAFAFFAAGRLGQVYDTYEIEKIQGAAHVAPIWGTAIFCSILSLIGMAPFAIFMSKLQLLKAMIDQGSYYSLGIFIFGSATVFVSALQHAITMTWGNIDKEEATKIHSKSRAWEYLLVVFCIILLVVAGLYLPDCVIKGINEAAKTIGGGF